MNPVRLKSQGNHLFTCQDCFFRARYCFRRFYSLGYNALYVSIYSDDLWGLVRRRPFACPIYESVLTSEGDDVPRKAFSVPVNVK